MSLTALKLSSFEHWALFCSISLAKADNLTEAVENYFCGWRSISLPRRSPRMMSMRALRTLIPFLSFKKWSLSKKAAIYLI
jgi:hypothetical protein